MEGIRSGDGSYDPHPPLDESSSRVGAWFQRINPVRITAQLGFYHQLPSHQRDFAALVQASPPSSMEALALRLYQIAYGFSGESVYGIAPNGDEEDISVQGKSPQEQARVLNRAFHRAATNRPDDPALRQWIEDMQAACADAGVGRKMHR